MSEGGAGAALGEKVLGEKAGNDAGTGDMGRQFPEMDVAPEWVGKEEWRRRVWQTCWGLVKSGARDEEAGAELAEAVVGEEVPGVEWLGIAQVDATPWGRDKTLVRGWVTVGGLRGNVTMEIPLWRKKVELREAILVGLRIAVADAVDTGWMDLHSFFVREGWQQEDFYAGDPRPGRWVADGGWMWGGIQPSNMYWAVRDRVDRWAEGYLGELTETAYRELVALLVREA